MNENTVSPRARRARVEAGCMHFPAKMPWPEINNENMAGGRRKKAPKTNKTKSKLDRSKTSKGEETQDITSSTTEVKSEKEKPIQNGCGKGQNQASESTSSPLESKYVPPFSRSSKNSSKNDEKSLGKSQIQTSQTLKRRLDESTDEISSENSSSSSCLKLKSKDDCTTSTNSTKKVCALSIYAIILLYSYPCLLI